MTEMTVALTGSTGFVGRHAAAAFLDRGLSVRALLRPRAASPLPDHPCLVQVEGRLDDRSCLEELCRGAEVVVHCAGLVAALDPGTYLRVNAEGTRNLVAAARTSGVRKFVHVSSLAAREPALSPYAASKAAGETALRDTAGGMPYVILRPPAVYGPGDRATLPLIAALRRPLILLPGDRAARLSLIHVSDLARALAVVALEDGIPQSIYEISDGREGGYGLAELGTIAARLGGRTPRVVVVPRRLLAWPARIAAAVFRLRGKAGMFTPGKLAEIYHRDWVSRGARLEAVSSWRPEIGFAEGFEATVAWYVENGWLQKPRTAAGVERNKKGSVLS